MSSKIDEDKNEPEIKTGSQKDEQNNQSTKEHDAEMEIAKDIENEAIEAKKKADEEIHQNNYEKAYVEYAHASQNIRLLKMRKIYEEKHINELIKDILIPSYLNLSYIDIKLKTYKGCVDHSSQVLEYKPNHAKALYRRCIAYINLYEFTKASNDLNQLKGMLNGGGEIEYLENLFNEIKKKYEQNEGKKYKKMLKGYKSEDRKDNDEFKVMYYNTNKDKDKDKKEINNVKNDKTKEKFNIWNYIYYVMCCCKAKNRKKFE